MKKQKLHFSRLLSLVLSLALLCTALSVLFSVSAADDTPSGTSADNLWDGEVADETPSGTTIWDGDVATEGDLKLKTEGANSAENPYLIDCAEKLAYIARAGADATNGKYYELTCDIYLNNVTGDNWYTTNSPRQWFDTNNTTIAGFQGKLNGNGHVIYGIYIDESERENAGLFMKTEGGASISNLGIEKSYIKGKTNVGAFAGLNHDWHNLDLINCYSSDTVILSSYDNYTSWQTSIGGLIGVLSASNGGDASQLITIENCYSAATGSDKDHMGGLFGKAHTSAGKVRIANCYSSQDSMQLIGFTNYIEGGTFENNYSKVSTGKWNGTALDPLVSSRLTTAQMTGSAAYTNMTGFDFNSVWHVFDGGTPKLRVFDFPGKNLEPEIWDGETDVSTSLEGEGTIEKPFLIQSAADLAYFAKGIWSTYAGKYTKLMTDIYLNDVSAPEWYNGENLNTWTPGSAPGYFDGNGHVIHGIYIENSDNNGIGGLFGDISTNTDIKISNLGIEDSYISVSTVNGSAGALFNAVIWGDGRKVEIENCYSSDTVILKGYKVAGLAGYTGKPNTSFKNCYSSAQIFEEGTNAVGGALVADCAGSAITFSNCYSTSQSKDLVRYGYGNVTFTDCYAGIKWFLQDIDAITQLNSEQMLGDGMTEIANDTTNWATNPKSTPTLAVFPIDGDVNGDKRVDIRDLVLANQVSLGTAGYNLINFATTNLDNVDGLYTINDFDINKIRAGKLLGLDF